MFVRALEVCTRAPQAFPTHKLLRARFVSSVHRLVSSEVLCPLVPGWLGGRRSGSLTIAVVVGGLWARESVRAVARSGRGVAGVCHVQSDCLVRPHRLECARMCCCVSCGHVLACI